jgi:diguanylate cyclase (GGDEF)-like protein
LRSCWSLARERDLAARLAGDEFVVLLSDADEATAAEIVARVQSAVAAFHWGSISPGLDVGLSQAVADDTVETLVHRSDRSMYSEKAQARWEPTRL